MIACDDIGVNAGEGGGGVKNPQKQKERKHVVTKDIRSFFGGSTIIKSSGPLNSKEKKIFKID